MRIKTLFAILLLAVSFSSSHAHSASVLGFDQNSTEATLLRKKKNPRERVEPRETKPSASTPAYIQARPLKTVQELTVMAYNVENLFLKLGKFERMSDSEFRRVTDVEIKSEESLEGIAVAIRDTDPDFIVLAEVEGVEAIQRFSETHLNNRYVGLLTEGNDERGIQIGFLVKRDLPLDITLESHKDATWLDPDDRQVKRVFSRDVPALVVRRKGESADAAPLLIFMGNHAKSQRDRGNDKGSVELRTAQYEAMAKIVDGYQEKYGREVPMMIGGDFNIDVRRAPDMKAIRSRMVDPLDIMKVTGDDRVTQTFHPRGGRTQMNQLDAVLVCPALENSIVSASVYRYKDANGNVKRLPQSFEERSQNPSDHFPVVVRISTENIFPEAHENVRARASGF